MTNVSVAKKQISKRAINFMLNEMKQKQKSTMNLIHKQLKEAEKHYQNESDIEMYKQAIKLAEDTSQSIHVLFHETVKKSINARNCNTRDAVITFECE